MTRLLVERARGGDHDAFAALVREQVAPLFGLAYTILRDRGRAEDAVQEAFLHAWRDLPRLRDPDRFGAWLRRLVVNAAHDEGRRARRHRPEVAIPPGLDFAGISGVDGLEDRDEMARAFARLREEDRAVLALRYYLDLSSADGAAAMGLREVTYRSRLHRALGALTASMAAEARRAVTEGQVG